MEFTAFDIGLIPLIAGLIMMATQLGLPKKYAPVLSLALGLAGGLVYLSPGNVEQGVLVGIALGLSPVGLYSGTKNIYEKVAKTK